MRPMSSEGSRSAVIAALLGNSTIAVAKFVAALFTGSAGMLAEAFHSVADTGNQLFLLRGLAVSHRGRSVEHPFGRGKEVYFWSFMVAVMLFVGGGVLAIQRGVQALQRPYEVTDFISNFVVLGVAIVIESLSFRVALRHFNNERGSRGVWRSLRGTKDSAVLVVLLEDSAAIVGLTVAGAGLALTRITGSTMWDGLASIVIGVLLGIVAVLLASETKELLVGEAADRSDRSAVRAVVLSVEEVDGIGKLLTMHMGPDEVLVNIEVDMRDDLTGEEVEAVMRRIETAIRGVLPEAGDIFVEPIHV
ncbi:MAG TPA: cation diffusion facilitator family transporter [Actinobacteria bacterium]|nr:cation diffusion facilitator family transporter [Actinomycetota bacterium]